MKYKEEDANKVKEILPMVSEYLFGEGDDIIDMFSLYEKKAPGMWVDWIAGGFLRYMEEATIDPKTTELILLGMCVVQRCSGGVLFHTMSALNLGIPESQIFDVLQLAGYEGGKIAVVEAASMVREGINRYEKAVGEGKVKKREA